MVLPEPHISPLQFLGLNEGACLAMEEDFQAPLFVHALQELGEIDAQPVGDLGHVDEGDVAEARLD